MAAKKAAGPAPKPPRRFIKFNAQARELYLQKLREEGLSRAAAAKAIDVDRVDIWRYRKAHPEYDAKVREAELSAVEFVEDALFQQATAGNYKAIEFYLCNRAPERWAARRNVELKANMAVEQRDPLPAVLEVLDAHPDAKAELIKRIEMTSP